MYFLLNFIGVFVVMGIVFLCSPNKKAVKWKPIASLIILELLITWFMLGTTIGSWVIHKIASFFTWLIACASEGIAFAFPTVMANETIDFFFSALLPIIFIVTFLKKMEIFVSKEVVHMVQLSCINLIYHL